MHHEVLIYYYLSKKNNNHLWSCKAPFKMLLIRSNAIKSEDRTDNLTSPEMWDPQAVQYLAGYEQGVSMFCRSHPRKDYPIWLFDLLRDFSQRKQHRLSLLPSKTKDVRIILDAVSDRGKDTQAVSPPVPSRSCLKAPRLQSPSQVHPVAEGNVLWLCMHRTGPPQAD